ncbi:hypothetical protein [Flavobacterium sp.]|uniref:hypothetical protein n=1 Tax=Flavobacterium sp. TaxID=239 RepID=UPI0038FCC57D
MIEKRKALVQISARVSKDVLAWHTQAAASKNISLSEHIHFILDDFVASSSLNLHNLSVKDLDYYLACNNNSFNDDKWDYFKKEFPMGERHQGTIIDIVENMCIVKFTGGILGFCAYNASMEVGALRYFKIKLHIQLTKNFSLEN